MNIIIPMAGRGSRLRPHTLTTPKPLVPIAGKPIVQRLVEKLTANISEKVDEIAFVIGDFGEEIEQQLIKIAQDQGAKGVIYYQSEPLGPAHAIYCAEPSLKGRCMVAFSDTLFQSDFQFDMESEGVIWTQKVDNPSSFGVVTLNDENVIDAFVEKPEQPVSDLAIVGIYYFREGEQLREEIQYLMENDIRDKGEYQITSALENMKNKGTKFQVGEIDEWMDCGNKEAIIATNQKILEIEPPQDVSKMNAKIINSTIISPCYIGENVTVKNSVIGPYVSIGDDSLLNHSVVENTVIQTESEIHHAVFVNSMIGNKAYYKGTPKKVSLGDFSQLAD